MKNFDPIAALAAIRHEFGEHGGVNMSVETSSTFTVKDARTMPEIFQGHLDPSRDGCFLYGRHCNPTVYVLGRQIAALEGAEAGYCTASGMSAIAGTVLQSCATGDHVVCGNPVYGGTFALFNEFLPARTGLEFSFVDTTDLDAVAAAFRPRTRLLYVESLANPTLRVANIGRLAKLAHAHGALLVVDNTFAPLILSPIVLGADVVVHSLTKFINGASDVVGGAICGTAKFVTTLMDLHGGALMLLGPTMDPRLAYEISMRLPHLGLRMTEHGARTLEIARRLLSEGVPVIYPGLPGHPDHDLLRRIGNPAYGCGGVLCVDMETTERAYRFMEFLQKHSRFGYMAVSLGYFDTLMSCPGSSTSSELSEEDRRRAGISPGLVRMSIGYTGTLEQRWSQLRRALREVAACAG